MEEKMDVDKWILATGVNPRMLEIEGADHPKVLSYIDVLRIAAAQC
jgi:2,4-dienoyl-CoA reductase (NADPH2)